MTSAMDPSVHLYLDDPERLEFDARVVEVRPLSGAEAGVVLDRTAFYPTSGGQPHDTGTLAGLPVLEVVLAADGAVVHRMARAPVAGEVHGRVDAARRRDHMQQHSGQHLLSATCVALAGRHTLSFHLGTERCSIDLPGPLLAPEALLAIELRANELVWEARPVRARFLAPEEAMELRKTVPEGLASVRVVEIEGWDRNACCGTHVRRTSEIGLVRILRQEKVGDATRLEFACGYRALAATSRAGEQLDGLVRLLTCHPDELAERCAKLVEESKASRKMISGLEAQLASTRAAAWCATAERAGGRAVVVQAIEAEPQLAAHASAIVAAGAVAILGSAGSTARLLFARPDDLDLDLRPALAAACALVGGRGGGPPHRVQGAGPQASGLGAALAAARLEVCTRLGALRAL
jgi:alanyl-tRNA synthetase